MVHTSQQLTPPQLLDAGRRAEGEGKLDLALQFYRHLAEHYGYTGEAAEARNGIGRIGAAQAQSQPHSQAQSQFWHSNGNGHAHTHDPGRGAEPRPPRAQRRRPVAPRDHYRIGRVLAVLISALGWMTAALGVALPFALLLPGLTIPFLGPPQLVGAAVVLCAWGLFVVFCGQAARALFDQANAARELVALERAKLGSD
jgi:hypothetical protein